jgi:hypothetical protein
MNDKEVLKLALDALEHCKEVIIERGLGGNPEFAQKWGLTLPIERSEKAITAIKQALAAPTVQEPVAMGEMSEDPYADGWTDAMEAMKRTAPPAAQPAPGQWPTPEDQPVDNGPDYEDGPDEEGFSGPRPWNSFSQPAPVQEMHRYSPNGEGGMELDSLGAYVKHQDVTTSPQNHV